MTGPRDARWLPSLGWGLPQLDESRCIGCGDCVAVCSTRCLAKGSRFPMLLRPSDCVSCGVCSLICPTKAIRLGKGFAAETEQPSKQDI